MPAEIEAFDSFAGFEDAIEAGYRQRLAGLRHLRRSEQIAARQAATRWRAVARRDLADRRASANQARRERQFRRSATIRRLKQGGCQWP